MGTVWPLDDTALADGLNAESVEGPKVERCGEIVASIDAIQSRDAMRWAARSRPDLQFRGPGPFLIAWSPAGNVGAPDVPVLVWSLSDVINSTQATEMFADWAAEIERRPELWSDGWDLSTLRRNFRLWADKYGAMVLVLVE